MSIIQLAPGLKQIEINLWNPISIIICAWQYKNKSCSIRFGGLMSHSSTNWWIECYCRILPFFFFLYKNDLQKSQCVNVQILSSSAPLKPGHLRTIWNLRVFSVFLLSSHPFFSTQNTSCSLCHEMLAGNDGDFPDRGSAEFGLCFSDKLTQSIAIGH